MLQKLIIGKRRQNKNEKLMLNYITRKSKRFCELENSHYDKDPEQLSLTCDKIESSPMKFNTQYNEFNNPGCGIIFFSFVSGLARQNYKLCYSTPKGDQTIYGYANYSHSKSQYRDSRMGCIIPVYFIFCSRASYGRIAGGLQLTVR